jgi:hypothetical protein
MIATLLQPGCRAWNSLRIATVTRTLDNSVNELVLIGGSPMETWRWNYDSEQTVLLLPSSQRGIGFHLDEFVVSEN